MSSTSVEQRAFVDSNVLIYAYDGGAGEKTDAARALVRELRESQRGCVSLQVLQEFFVIATRKLPQRLDARTAREALEAFSTWTTHSPAAADVLAAVDLHEQASTAFWDAMIVRSASVLGCDVLYTEDLNDGQRYDGVLVVNPFAA
jgi:predicted nucleic acid-binding protein